MHRCSIMSFADIDLRSLNAAPELRMNRISQDQDMRQIPGPIPNPIPPPVTER